jgi:signal transduction histidine kinase
VPLKVRGELTGVVEVVSKNPGAFGDKELDTLGAIAGPVAVMLENARLLREVKRLHDELAQAAHAKAEVLATMTHEMRTPINIVIGNLDLVVRGFLGNVSERQRKCLETALRNSGEALNLVTSLLDLSRFEAGQYVMHVEDFRLEDIWSELETFFQVGLSGKSVELSWNAAGELPEFTSDRMKVKEILSNIVFNAVKYTDRGEVRVTATPLDKGRRVAIEVKDTGVGIPRTRLRSSSSRSARPKGRRREASAASASGSRSPSGWSSCSMAASRSKAASAKARPSVSCCRFVLCHRTRRSDRVPV